MTALLTAREAAAELRVSERVFRAHVQAGDVKHVLIGRRRRYTASDLEEFINTRRQKCPSTNRRGSRTTSTTSGGKVIGITEARLSRTGQAPRP